VRSPRNLAITGKSDQLFEVDIRVVPLLGEVKWPQAMGEQKVNRVKGVVV